MRNRTASFLIPGWGQIKNKDPFWKPAIFLGVELLGIYSFYNYDKKAELVRYDFESFADQHWTLETWYNNTKKIFPNKWKEILVGTHKLELNINGNYFAIDDTCTHAGGSLSEGKLEGSTITCDWHGAQFQCESGKLLKFPAKLNDLGSYKVLTESNNIFVET